MNWINWPLLEEPPLFFREQRSSSIEHETAGRGRGKKLYKRRDCALRGGTENGGRVGKVGGVGRVGEVGARDQLLTKNCNIPGWQFRIGKIGIFGSASANFPIGQTSVGGADNFRRQKSAKSGNRQKSASRQDRRNRRKFPRFGKPIIINLTAKFNWPLVFVPYAGHFNYYFILKRIFGFAKFKLWL